MCDLMECGARICEHHPIYSATTPATTRAVVDKNVTREHRRTCRKVDPEFGAHILIETLIFLSRSCAEHSVIIDVDIEVLRRVAERDVWQLCNARHVRATQWPMVVFFAPDDNHCQDEPH